MVEAREAEDEADAELEGRVKEIGWRKGSEKKARVEKRVGERGGMTFVIRCETGPACRA